MKKQLFTFTLAAAVLALVGSLSAQTQAPAAGATSNTKVGIINIQRAIVESEEGKAAAEKLQKQFSPRRDQLQGLQAEVEKLQKQLRDQDKTLSDEARANLVRQIDTKTKEFTRANDDATNDFQQAESQVINEIGAKVMKVLDEYAKKNAYQVVMDVSSPQSPVLWASSAIDVTDDIIKIYNTTAPAPSAAAPGGAKPTAPAAPAAKPATNVVPRSTPAAPPAAKKP